MLVRSILVLSLALGINVGCSKEEKRPSASAPAKTEHAAADVEPGSYEDWCEEHQVPESQCTRCNRSPKKGP